MTWIPDATAIKDFRVCPELFRLRHVEGFKREGFDSALSAGKALHAGLDTWFSGEISEPEAAVAAIEAAYDGPKGVFEADPKRPLSLLLNIMREYAKKFPREDDPFEVLATEEYVEAEIPVRHGCRGCGGTGMVDIQDAGTYANVDCPECKTFDYCGIQDLRINLNGQNLIVDYKTTGLHFLTYKRRYKKDFPEKDKELLLNQLFFDQFTLDVQMRGYAALQLALGRPCDGVYINAIHIDNTYHTIKPAKHFLRYGPILFDQEQLGNWARDMESDLERIDDLKNITLSRWPQYQAGCTAYFRRCTFFATCRMPCDLAERVLGLEFKRERWNPKVAAANRKVDSR